MEAKKISLHRLVCQKKCSVLFAGHTSRRHFSCICLNIFDAEGSMDETARPVGGKIIVFHFLHANYI